MKELPLPSLYHNGALDPDNWQPSLDNFRNGARHTIAEEGDLVGWRYGAWRVIEVRLTDEADFTDKQRKTLDAYLGGLKEEYRPRAFMRRRPRVTVLRHESGPFVVKPGEKPQRLHDGGRTFHFGTSGDGNAVWAVLDEPYKTCSCHGHIWPCQEIDRNTLALHEARKTNKLLATADPGTCAHCLEAITTRQRTLTFPEPSRLVPGAPGPTFHAGRAACWAAAEEYERKGRLADNPDIERLASCPGVRFIHERHGMPAEQRLECTAGPFCTGKHGPSGHHRPMPCWYRHQIAANDGAYARPNADCGYRGGHGACLGGDLSSGGSSISPTAGDLLWEQRNRY